MTLLIGRLVLVCLVAVTVSADEPVAEQKPGPVAVKEPVAVADTVASVVVPETKTKFFENKSTPDTSNDNINHEIIVIPNPGNKFPVHHYGGSPPTDTIHVHKPYPYQPYYPPQPHYYPQYHYIPQVYAPVPSIPSIPTYPSLPTMPSLPYYPQQGYFQKPIVINSESSGSSGGKPIDGLWSLFDQKHTELFDSLFGNKGESTSSDKIHEVVVINAKPADYSGYGFGHGHGHGHGTNQGWFIKGKHAHSSDCKERK